MSTDWSYRNSWPGTPADVGLARAFAVGHLQEHLLWPLVYDVRLVVSELASNAVQHARTAFSVTLEQRDDVVTLWVRDGSTEEPESRTSDLLAAGGRGLPLVSAYTADWGVVPEGTAGKAIWARFDTGARDPASAGARPSAVRALPVG
ncbi:ATP-binding protein [Nocardioides mesophilus]|uniref:ATP-binding protein n=1 Tax=Nocardioides mesophilus TaxID=433659 RepID=A0A7G9REX2_9ACTN|nr:ATP-binding protein [Nocardioides mesophilus]QNN54147.1 ATP-binding protein [Nocardioides mesophilus]